MPSANTIDNWTRKCGLDDVKHTPEALEDKEYAVVIDECMMIGSEKLLPVLAVPTEHQGQPIQPNDVKVIGLNVKQGWTAETVNAAVKDDVATVGKDPKYVITDNDCKMRKAVKLSGYAWHRDISHTLAMFMERTYKNDADFVDFNERMAMCKKQFCMKEVAYLQSPSQRVKARFMNLSDCVDWADSMLQVFYRLKPNEQEVFSFIPMYASFIDELKEIVSCIRHIETEMKHHGLSKTTIAECRHHVSITAMQGNDRMQAVGMQILAYLKEEENQLGEEDVVNNSSDIIESMFGMFKFMQSPNKLNGVTTLVLHLPVMLALKESTDSKNYNVNVRLIRTRMKDITQWRDENLSENLVTKRINTLRA